MFFNNKTFKLFLKYKNINIFFIIKLSYILNIKITNLRFIDKEIIFIYYYKNKTN